jgi:hypothetical protein
LSECKNFIVQNRYGVVFGDELVKRTAILSPTCWIPATLDVVTRGELLEEFSVETEVKKAQKLFDTAKAVQTLSRGKYGKKYLDQKKAPRSGVYQDTDILSDILKHIVHDRINDNYKKAVHKEVKGASGGVANEDELVDLKTSIEKDKLQFYEEKRAKWREEGIPDLWLAFILCGPPGLQLKALMAETTTAVHARGADGRAAMRSLKRKRDEEGKELENGKCSSSNTVDLTADEASMAKHVRTFVHNHRLELRLKLLNQKALSLHRYAEMVQHTNPQEYERCGVEYVKVMREIAFMDTEALLISPEENGSNESNDEVE